MTLALASAVGVPGVAASEPDPIARELGRGMAGFVSSLDEDQRDEALFEFEDDERFDLRLAPIGLEGLPIEEMTTEQWRQLEALLGEVLSPSGLAKMNTIRSLEREVAELEGGLFGFLMARLRDARRYFLALFGEPSSEAVWGLRFDGHHLSLNWTAVPDQPLSVSPLFLGGQPRLVPEPLERAGLRVLAEEEDRAVELVNGLEPAARSASRLPFSEGSAIRRPMSVAGEVPLELAAPAGVGWEALDPASRSRLLALIDVVLDNFAAPIAERHRRRIEGRKESLHFAHAVASEREQDPIAAGESLYYRIQGERFLIEFDNTSEAADHVHLVWRDLGEDFGRDPLAEHWAVAHP